MYVYRYVYICTNICKYIYKYMYLYLCLYIRSTSDTVLRLFDFSAKLRGVVRPLLL